MSELPAPDIPASVWRGTWSGTRATRRRCQVRSAGGDAGVWAAPSSDWTSGTGSNGSADLVGDEVSGVDGHDGGDVAGMLDGEHADDEPTE